MTGFSGMGQAICWGSLSAAVAMIVQMGLEGYGSMTADNFAILLLLIMPSMLFAAIMVALAALIVGLPLVLALSLVSGDRPAVLTPVGAVIGLVLPLALMIADGFSDPFFSRAFAIAGSLGGGVTGGVWGMVRAARHRTPAANRYEDERILR